MAKAPSKPGVEQASLPGKDLLGQPLPSPKTGGNTPAFSVSGLSAAIKTSLEDGFGHVRLRGEISGYRGPHSSGHCYFSLKDDRSKIDAVIWKGSFQRLRFRPEEGMDVIAQGRVTTFPGSSKYQIVVETLEPAGAGALMAMLEERKRRFAAEGLFADERKKPRPFLPRVVGIVTSPTGAVIRDMLAGFEERCPTRVIIWPVRVQGEGSAGEIAAAIRGFNEMAADGPIPRPDVLIVARGGGSLEDLWGFNEEIVVRAAADSKIPLISAVGHETDWTLLDLVADARAPTPTKAAEWAVPMYSELVRSVEQLRQRQRVTVRRLFENFRVQLKAASRGLPRPSDLVSMPRQRFDNVEHKLHRALLTNTRVHGLAFARLTSRLRPQTIGFAVRQGHDRVSSLQARAVRAIANGLSARRRSLDSVAQLAEAYSYHGVLARGFALVRNAQGEPVRQAMGLTVGQHLALQFNDGRTRVVVRPGDDVGVVEPHGGNDVPAVASKPAAKVKGKPGRDQGSLF